MRPRRRPAVMVLALTAGLVTLLQLAGPATCPNLSWRWVALALEDMEDHGAEERTDEAALGEDLVANARPVCARSPGHAGTVAASPPPHAGPDALVDAGVTRAPPAA